MPNQPAENSQPLDLFAAAPLPVAVLDDAQRLACLRLIRSENVGPATFRALINHFGGAREALAALPEMGRRAGRGRPVRIHPADAAEAEIEAARAAGVELLFTIEPGYPGPLAFTEGAPPLLYVKGRTALLNRTIIAIVGSRQASAAGVQVARMFAARFGEAGHVVSSGLARGIDGAAHQATLETGTVAVLAGGLDVFYPPEHRDLQTAIGERGCLVSEQPLGFVARAQDFPRRNRIISGLSRAVVVVEAARRSGTLITARFANEQGRDVFAVPGHPLDPRAEGTNQLLKDGAGLATSAEDVLSALEGLGEGPGFRGSDTDVPVEPKDRADDKYEGVRSGAGSSLGEGTIKVQRSRGGASAERRSAAAGESMSSDEVIGEVRRVLGPVPVSSDDIARVTGLAARAVQVAIMELALGDQIEFHGGQLVSLKRSG